MPTHQTLPKTPAAPAEFLSFADAAEKLLRAEGRALSHNELAKRALAKKLVATESQTPQISMHVSMRGDMKRREQRGEPQRFLFLGNGLFSLVDLEAGSPTAAAKSALDQIRESRLAATLDLHKRLVASNNGPNFELMVADLLVAMGYEDVEVIGGKDDQGVDIVCEKRDGVLRTRIAIQCKCKAANLKIGPKDVSTLRDNLSTYQCQQGILVTTTTLNDVARQKAMESGKERIHFIEQDELMDLFAEFGVGVRSEPVKFYQVDASKYDFLK
jgi:Restriction endonuclease/HB1, ASXL, restriction endonuclease HTH domain